MRELTYGRGCVPMIDSHELSEWGIYYKIQASERKTTGGGGTDDGDHRVMGGGTGG